MLTESSLYWITRLDGFRNLSITMVLISITMTVIFLICVLDRDNPEANLKRMCAAVLIDLLLAVTLVFIPTTKEMCVIKVLPAIANNEKIQGIGDKALSLTEEWLDGLISDKKKK